MTQAASIEFKVVGESLRSLRRAASLTGVELADRTGMSQSKISKLETGRQLPSDDDLRALSEALQLHPHQQDDLFAETQRARDHYRPWSYRGLRLTPRTQKYIAAAEETATLVRECSQTIVPGLLQTPAYTRALLDLLPYELDVSATVGERLARQQILFDIEDRQFQFVLRETALTTIVGSESVMRGQLDRLISLNETMSNVEIAVLPSDARLPAPLISDFAIYDDRLVDIELLIGQVAIEEPGSIAIYARVFDAMLHETKLYDSNEIIRRILARLLSSI